MTFKVMDRFKQDLQGLGLGIQSHPQRESFNVGFSSIKCESAQEYLTTNIGHVLG